MLGQLGTSDADKRTAAAAAVLEVEHGMRVGLGTGSTMAFVIAALGDRVRSGLRCEIVSTSLATTNWAGRSGLRVVDFAALESVDLGIDGADEIDPCCRAIKGRGGAMLREKIVAAAATRMIAVVDDRKLVGQLGRGPVSVEVLPFALTAVARTIERHGSTVVVRRSPDGPFLTDQGNAVLDCRFGTIDAPERLATILSEIPGVLGHGLFLSEIDAVYIGSAHGVSCRERAATLSPAAAAR